MDSLKRSDNLSILKILRTSDWEKIFPSLLYAGSVPRCSNSPRRSWYLLFVRLSMKATLGLRPLSWRCFQSTSSLVFLRRSGQWSVWLCSAFSPPLGEQHHHHRHQSLNREGRWGTTDVFATSFLHFSLFSTALWNLPNSRPVHSLMLSSHLFLCPPCLLPPFTVPCKMVLARPDERKT